MRASGEEGVRKSQLCPSLSSDATPRVLRRQGRGPSRCQAGGGGRGFSPAHPRGWEASECRANGWRPSAPREPPRSGSNKTFPASTWDRGLPRRRTRGGAGRQGALPPLGREEEGEGWPRIPVPTPAHQLPVRFLSTVPWAQRLRTCCTDRLIMEWSPPSAFIFPGGRPPPSPRAPGGGSGCEAPGAAAGARLLQAAAAGQGCGAPGWALLLRPTDLRGGPLSASPRQPPPRRGDIEDGGRGRGGGPALSPRGPPARTRCGGGRRRSRSGAAPRRGDRARWEAEVTPGGAE